MNVFQLINILVHFFSFLVYVCLIIFILQRDPKALLNRLCALTIVPFAIWAFAITFFHSVTTENAARVWINIASIGWCSFPITAFWFYLVLTGHETVLRKRIFIIPCILLAVFFIFQQWGGHLIIDLVKQPYGWSTVWATSLWPSVFFTYYFAFTAGCIYVTFTFWLKTKSLRKKRQMKILWITPVLCLAFGSVTDVILPQSGIGVVPPIACVIILFWAAGLVYAITRYQLMTLTPAAAADNILSTMSDSLILVDPEGKIIHANRAAFDLLGYEEHELIGEEFTAIASQPGSAGNPFSLQLLEEGSIDNKELTYRSKNGKELSVLISASAMHNEEKELIGYITVARDITEYKKLGQALKESEQKYRSLVDHALIGIGIHQKGRLVFANRKLADMLGYTLEESIGLPIAERIHPDDRAMVMARAQRRQAGYPEPETYEIRLLKKDGSCIYALISNAVIEYEWNSATLMTIADSSDTKARKDLEQAYKELEAFSYSVSHDLRAPLRSIDGFSQALLEDYADKLDAEGKDFLHRVRAASQRMAQLIDDLLKLSRITRTEIHYEQVDLTAMVRKIIVELKEMEPGRSVDFRIAEGVIAYGDTALLQVVLVNLLSNAWKFTGKHPHATIEFGEYQQEGQTVYFVRDDGAGFDMAYVNKLFAPFQRLHVSTEFEGTGIGLATIQRIIHRHGGTVWAEGQVEQGATFYFTLQANK
ncbi:MAG TPA: PAS domain S-box protein [Spirochaetia bacterium]|nr:PAS domain S-box protein [Spirochaetia bacterium]